MPYVGLPEDAVVFEGLPEGAQILPSEAPKRPPINPRIDSPEGGIYQGNPRWKESVHDFVAQTIPWTGAGLGAAAGASTVPATGPGATLAAAGGSGIGYATGKKVVGAVDALMGYREPPPRAQDTGAKAALRTTRDLLVGANAELGSQLAVGALGKGVEKAAEYVAKRGPRGVDEAAVADAVNRGMTKGVRPTVVGKRNWGQRAKAGQRATDAVKAIVENKGSLEFTDAAGNVTRGELPRDLNQFSQAIDQTKKRIFERYDGLAQEAGQSGARVNLAPIAEELRAVASKEGMGEAAPSAAQYARELADALERQGAYSAQGAQNYIQAINSQQQAFHKAATPNLNQSNWVDELAAVRMREALDSAIEGAQGPGYQALKNQYGALRSIEQDVNHRGVVVDRQNVRSLTDFIGDAAAALEVARGLASKDPASFAAAAGVKGVSKLTKHLNNPNRVIGKMFQEVEGLIQKGSTPTAFGSLASRIAANRAATQAWRQEQEAAWQEAQGLGKSPYDSPTFQRLGRNIDLEAADQTNAVARGHTPILTDYALPPGQGFEMTGSPPAPMAVLPPDPIAHGARPVLGPNPQPLALPQGQGFLAPGLAPEAAPVEFARGMAPFVESRPPVEPQRFSPSLVEQMGGAGDQGLGAHWRQAPEWMRGETRTAYAPARKTLAEIEAEVRAALPPNTPDGIVQFEVNRFLEENPWILRRGHR